MENMAKKRPKIKLPNGFGSITELSGNRRKPYMVYVTTGWDASGKQDMQKTGMRAMICLANIIKALITWKIKKKKKLQPILYLIY